MKLGVYVCCFIVIATVGSGGGGAASVDSVAHAIVGVGCGSKQIFPLSAAIWVDVQTPLIYFTEQIANTTSKMQLNTYFIHTQTWITSPMK